jgi:hypothetical protein
MFTALVLAGSMILVTVPASAEPPAAAAQPPPPALPVGGFQPPSPPAPLAEKPSLIKELPIAAYVTTGVTAIVGAIVNVFGGNAASELKIPADHTTPGQTHTLVVHARIGEVVSGVFFGFTGASALWGTISTIRAVKKISSFVTLPPVGVTAAPLPGGVALGLGGRF